MPGKLNKLRIVILLIILFVLLYNGYIKYQSKPIGTSVKFEKNFSIPDFSFCPWFYRKGFEIKNINSQSGHKVQDVMDSLSSFKELIKTIMKGDVNSINNISNLYVSPDWRTEGMNNDSFFNQDSLVESFSIIEHNSFNLQRCITIQWPEEIQLDMNSFVSKKVFFFLQMYHFFKKFSLKISIILDSSKIKFMAMQFHDRGNSEIMTQPHYYVPLNFPIIAR